MKLKLLLFLPIFFSFCRKQDNNPAVYLGFKMGHTKAQTQQKISELKNSNLLSQVRSLDYHTTTTSVYNKRIKYFSTPVFYINPGETIITKISVIYFDDLSYANLVEENRSNGDMNMGMFLGEKYKDEENLGSLVKTDVINSLKEKYGKNYTNGTSNFMGVHNQTMKWENVNGLNITLSYAWFKTELVENAGLRLDFEYTEQMKKKLVKKVSVY